MDDKTKQQNNNTTTKQQHNNNKTTTTQQHNIPRNINGEFEDVIERDEFGRANGREDVLRKVKFDGFMHLSMRRHLNGE